MDKNTILAIVLSTLVLIVSLFVQTNFILPRQQAKAELQAAEIQAQEEEKAQKAAAEREMISADFLTEENSAEEIPEQNFSVKTNKVEVIFTNRGGDIVSYRLLEHNDKSTNYGVEMVLNSDSENRALAISLGDAENSILNDIFKVSVKDDSTILFYRDYEIKGEDGSTNRFTLGKRYTFSPDEYVFKLDVSIFSAEGTKISLGGNSYTIRTSPQIGPKFDKKNRYEVREFLALNGGKKFRKGVSEKYYDFSSVDWAGIGGKYFTMLLKPADSSVISEKVKVSSKNGAEENAQVLLSRKEISGGSANDTYFVYVGPRQERELIKYNDQTKNAWNLSNTKFNEALRTSGFLSWIEVILKWCLEKINLLVHNWGVSIIILTVILKIILFPMNKNSAVGSLKMQKLQPRMKALQEKYKDDQQKLGVEMQKLYKEVGYNPMSGCLPMIVQMFILFALYNVFNNYFEFRGASFVKGWIDDLSSGDSIFSWNRNIPFISAFTMNNLRILPFVYTASQLLNGKITQYGNAGASTNQGQMKFMMYGMPVMFFFLFYNVPSGLLLYWATSNILQIGQQLVINRVMNKKRAEIEKSVDKNVLKFKGGKKKTR
jgi:YidC/Oxa1 family membrane protein insertase